MTWKTFVAVCLPAVYLRRMGLTGGPVETSRCRRSRAGLVESAPVISARIEHAVVHEWILLLCSCCRCCRSMCRRISLSPKCVHRGHKQTYACFRDLGTAAVTEGLYRTMPLPVVVARKRQQILWKHQQEDAAAHYRTCYG